MKRLSTDDRNRLAKFHQRLQLLSFLRGQGSIVIAIHQILQPLVGLRRQMKTGDCFDHPDETQTADSALPSVLQAFSSDPENTTIV
ncbi:MAG TPA: hypothetical protein VKF17_02235 [Isosphaeraceae bacterium]|nr:hypothetical protein [Isosphaeraceae bacterium]